MIVTFPIKRWLRKRNAAQTMTECRTQAHTLVDEDIDRFFCEKVERVGVDWMLTINTENDRQAEMLRSLLEQRT